MKNHIKQIILIAIFLISLLLFVKLSFYLIEFLEIPKLLREMGFAKNTIIKSLTFFLIVFSNFASALLTVILNAKFIKYKKEKSEIRKL